ncbi:MAG: hypothetical protein WC627_04740 [Legionella sp.]|jgi:hypothetical protein
MTEQIIKLSPLVTPQAFYETNKELLGLVPDGTGMQIVFKIKGQNVVLAGPRGRSVMTVNGGTVENPAQPFVKQIVEEFEEESFGVLKLIQNSDNTLSLSLNGKIHALAVQEDKSFVGGEVGKYMYVTFTAVCETATMEELEQAAASMNPTAAFWNRIGNHLFSHLRSAPKDDTFSTYWASKAKDRASLIEELAKTDEETLLTKPTQVFGTKTIAEALAKLNEIDSHKAFMTMFKHTVGRFSERSGYYIFETNELVNAVETGSKVVNDVNGVERATGIFNDSAVKQVLPSFLTKKRSSAELLNAVGVFGGSSSNSSVVVTQTQEQQNTI